MQNCSMTKLFEIPLLISSSHLLSSDSGAGKFNVKVAREQTSTVAKLWGFPRRKLKRGLDVM